MLEPGRAEDFRETVEAFIEKPTRFMRQGVIQEMDRLAPELVEEGEVARSQLLNSLDDVLRRVQDMEQDAIRAKDSLAYAEVKASRTNVETLIIRTEDTSQWLRRLLQGPGW